MRVRRALWVIVCVRAAGSAAGAPVVCVVWIVGCGRSRDPMRYVLPSGVRMTNAGFLWYGRGAGVLNVRRAVCFIPVFMRSCVRLQVGVSVQGIGVRRVRMGTGRRMMHQRSTRAGRSEASMMYMSVIPGSVEMIVFMGRGGGGNVFRDFSFFSFLFWRGCISLFFAAVSVSGGP